MEENVALDSSKQKQFVKSIKGIKNLIKKNKAERKSDDIGSIKDGKIHKKRKERGLVYLSHIPHGFYENEMTQYFKQFGVVTNARVIRSKRTGNSKGYAFVEFKEPAVGQIVAETMNNYLMGKRLIKAAYIPPEKQRTKAMRKRWSNMNNPGRDLRIKMKKAHNADKDEMAELKRARKILSNLSKTKKKLSELGISYDFFTPVDVPEALTDKVKVEEKQEEKKEIISNISTGNIDGKVKKIKKSKQGQTPEIKKGTVEDVKLKSGGKQKPLDKEIKGKGEKIKIIEKNANESKSVKKQQKERQMNLKESAAKPKPLEDFIKTQLSDSESDSTYEFDSDEYEKVLEHEDEFNSDKQSGGDSDKSDADGHSDEDNSDNEEINDESEEVITLKKVKGKKSTPKLSKSDKKNSGKHPIQKGFPQQVKIKSLQESAFTIVPMKKSKFEKQIKQKPRNKQFKKKK